MCKIKKLFLFVCVLIITYFILPVTASADGVEFSEVLNALIEALDSDSLNNELDGAWAELNLEEKTFKEKILSVINGDFSLNYSSALSAILNIIFSSVRSLIPILVSVCIIALLYSLLKAFNPDFLSEGTNKVVYFSCYAAILGLVLYKTFDVSKACVDSVVSYAKQMNAVFPLMLTVMTAMGATVSASVYQPAVAFLSNGITAVFTKAVIPLVGFLIIFSAVSGLTSAIKTEKLSSFVSSVIKWIIGICVTVFTMFLSIQGLTAGTYDGITLRITKYAIGNSVPIVGGFLKDGVDMFLVGGILIKNALGICGVVLILAAMLSPLFELIAFGLMLKLAAGLIEPLTDSSIPNLLTSLSKSLNYIMASVLIISFMYIITVILLICTGGALL